MPPQRHKRGGLKSTSVPIIQSYGQAQKNATSTYLKSGTSYLLGPNAAVDVTPDPETSFADVLVIHAGSRNLRIGRASDAVPRECPHVIVRKVHTPAGAPPSPSPSDGQADSNRLPFGADIVDDPSVVRPIEDDIKQRLRALKIRSVPNAHSQVVGYNTQSQPETILDHNDPYKIEWTQFEYGQEYAFGMKALRVPELNSSKSSSSDYRLFYPIQHGMLNTRDYSTIRACLNDLSKIWTAAIEEELNIPRKEFGSYNVVCVVPDTCGGVHVREIASVLLRDMKFKAFVMLQVTAETSDSRNLARSSFGNAGNIRTNVKYGGDDMTAFFTKVLLRSEFPYSNIQITANVYDWLLAEELKERMCTLNEVDMSVNVTEFTVRSPEHQTSMYKVKLYDEPMIAAMVYFYPQVIDFISKLRHILYRETFLDWNADDENDGDNVTADQEQMANDAYNSYVNPLPSPKDVEPPDDRMDLDVTGEDEEPATSIANGADNPSPSKSAKSQSEEQLAEPPAATSASTSPAATSAPESTATPAIPSQPPKRAAPAMHFLRRRRVMGTLPEITHPLDLAVAQSIAAFAKAHPEAREKDLEDRVKKLCGSILLVGGGGMIHGLGRILEERVGRYLQQHPEFRARFGGSGAATGNDSGTGTGSAAAAAAAAAAPPLLPLTPQVLPSPREIDPRVLCWKGASVFAKLDMTNELWIGRAEWEVGGLQRTAGKWLFSWD
ncbi:actin-like protein arp8 [Rhizophlyctis rosea]|nr:actin-like protein arp8 [Rhizophlyctis rosea]